jgi:hypothetical protein
MYMSAANSITLHLQMPLITNKEELEGLRVLTPVLGLCYGYVACKQQRVFGTTITSK